MALINPNPVVYTGAAPDAGVARDDVPHRQTVELVFDLIRHIKDPEHPHSLEDLRVVAEQDVSVDIPLAEDGSELWCEVTIRYRPTVPHCSLATLIGLCIRAKLLREMPPDDLKLRIEVVPGTHSTAEEVTKQVNDKERVAAAMENPALMQTVEECIRDREFG